MTNLSCSTTKLMFEYWQNLPNEAGIPERKSVDPVDIPPDILPHIFLCSVMPVPFSVYFRLQGTFINSLLGQDFKGKKLNKDTFGLSASEIRALYQRVVDGRKPIVSHELITSRLGVKILIEVIHLPLLDETGEIGFIIGAIDILGPEHDFSKKFVSTYWTIQDTTDLGPS